MGFSVAGPVPLPLHTHRRTDRQTDTHSQKNVYICVYYLMANMMTIIIIIATTTIPPITPPTIGPVLVSSSPPFLVGVGVDVGVDVVTVTAV